MLYRSPNRFARKYTFEHLGVFHHNSAVNHDIGDTGGRQRILSFLEGGIVAHGVWIKDRDIGIRAYLQAAFRFHYGNIAFQASRRLDRH